MRINFLYIVFLIVAAKAFNFTNNHRQKKSFGIFSIVTFPNVVCSTSGSSQKNGTCYTKEECINKGGKASGTCASSFGVCCLFEMLCGSRLSENNTYMRISPFNPSTDTSPCTYTICRCDTNVCKLRLDFEMFSIASPFSTEVDATTTAIELAAKGAKFGHCITDSFTVSSTGSENPPTICGANIGQHIYVDITDSCDKLTFNLDTNVANPGSRTWSIKATQLECGKNLDTDHSCLQYHRGVSGSFSSFNYKTGEPHLARQNYDICFRRESGYCKICFSPKSDTSYGVSASSDAAASKSAVDTTCTGVPGPYGDYIEADLVKNDDLSSVKPTFKICGAIFNSIGDQTVRATACSYRTPFVFGVHFDGQEALVAPSAAGGAAPDLTTAENIGGNPGYTGFQMDFFQEKCTTA